MPDSRQRAEDKENHKIQPMLLGMLTDPRRIGDKEIRESQLRVTRPTRHRGDKGREGVVTSATL